MSLSFRLHHRHRHRHRCHRRRRRRSRRRRPAATTVTTPACGTEDSASCTRVAFPKLKRDASRATPRVAHIARPVAAAALRAAPTSAESDRASRRTRSNRSKRESMLAARSQTYVFSHARGVCDCVGGAAARYNARGGANATRATCTQILLARPCQQHASTLAKLQPVAHSHKRGMRCSEIK